MLVCDVQLERKVFYSLFCHYILSSLNDFAVSYNILRRASLLFADRILPSLSSSFPLIATLCSLSLSVADWLRDNEFLIMK